MTVEPERLIHEDASSALGDLLRSAQDDVLSEDAVARLRSRLAASGVGLAPGAPPASPLASRLVGHLAGKIVIGVVAMAVVVGGTLAATRAPRRPLVLAPIQRSPEAAVTPARVRAIDPPTPASAALGPVGPVGPLDAPSPSASAPVATPSQRSILQPAQPAQPATALAAQPAPVSSGRAAPSAREGALLLQARRALDADPARALALVTIHEAEFPDSQLSPERTRIAAEARRRLQP